MSLLFSLKVAECPHVSDSCSFCLLCIYFVNICVCASFPFRFFFFLVGF